MTDQPQESSGSCFGCLGAIVGGFLVIFVLFHLKDLWALLERLIK